MLCDECSTSRSRGGNVEHWVPHLFFGGGGMGGDLELEKYAYQMLSWIHRSCRGLKWELTLIYYLTCPFRAAFCWLFLGLGGGDRMSIRRFIGERILAKWVGGVRLKLPERLYGCMLRRWGRIASKRVQVPHYAAAAVLKVSSSDLITNSFRNRSNLPIWGSYRNAIYFIVSLIFPLLLSIIVSLLCYQEKDFSEWWWHRQCLNAIRVRENPPLITHRFIWQLQVHL